MRVGNALGNGDDGGCGFSLILSMIFREHVIVSRRAQSSPVADL